MKFTVLFWNIWLDNQLQGESGATALLRELDSIINMHRPDFIGLNEVLRTRTTQRAYIFDYLKSVHGYTFNYFALASPYDDTWDIGAGFCAHRPPAAVHAIPISQDTPAKRRGYPGHKLRIIAADVRLQKQSVRIIVAHPMHLRTYTLREHYTGTKNLEAIIRQHSGNTIVGGDFNEPGFMPGAFKHKLQDILSMRTGTGQAATWRLNAHPQTWIRANLDQLYWTLGNGLELENFEVIDTAVSDHRPLVATFRLGD